MQQTAPASADTIGFAQSFRESLKEVAGFKTRGTNKSDAKNQPDVEPTQSPFQTNHLWT